MMHPSDLQRMIMAGESEVLDFKKTIPSAAKIAKTLVAFANHKGGKLLIGVNDNKTISGIRSEEEKYMIDLAANFFCKPVPVVDIIEHELGKKTVLEAIIHEGTDKPYYAKDEEGKWWVYIRVKDKSLLASKITVEVLKKASVDAPSTLIKYSRHEQTLLNYLDKNERITLPEFCKMANISRWRASKILINLASIGIIRVHTNEKTEFYTLS